jgi:putative hydrolase of the HAD superfamily
MAPLRYKAVFFDIGKTLVAENTSVWNPGARALLAGLRQQNVRLGLLSNTGDLTRDELEPRLPADFAWDLFDLPLIILSSEVGVAKPKREIFLKAVAAAAAPAASCLYCSEDALEVLAAQIAGMSGARVNAIHGELNTLLETLRGVSLLD